MAQAQQVLEEKAQQIRVDEYNIEPPMYRTPSGKVIIDSGLLDDELSKATRVSPKEKLPSDITIYQEFIKDGGGEKYLQAEFDRRIEPNSPTETTLKSCERIKYAVHTDRMRKQMARNVQDFRKLDIHDLEEITTEYDNPPVYLSSDMMLFMESIGIKLLQLRMYLHNYGHLILKQLDFAILVWNNALRRFVIHKLRSKDYHALPPGGALDLVKDIIKELRQFNELANAEKEEEVKLDLLHYGGSVINTLLQVKRLVSKVVITNQPIEPNPDLAKDEADGFFF